ncbi:hypothetical protein N7532_001742 [Penicillium argentinense]|uniref:Sodium/calcium exchanger membrane region domain-containing protein n=1 Tax=Penicillium argentinense TaxID=1131581 RepID=A0A9W9G374_9EURO|nr:uncharacterized protein N7532_001742 [Penicillium argentinense]KAJ5111207.1 hypothetical protein N7532_001742 [Penicillium argentinense]
MARAAQFLPLLPIAGTVAGVSQLPAIVVFALNLGALAVLMNWILRCIHVVSVHSGRLTHELLKGTLGNGVELMIGVSSIIQGVPSISRSIILGSILCNLLLVLGSALFFAGYDKNRLRFDRTLTTTLSSLMMVVFIMLAIPTAMEALSSRKDVTDEDTMMTLHITAITLIALLCTFLFFRLRTHADMFAGTPFHDGSERRTSHGTLSPQALPPLTGRSRTAFILLAASSGTLTCAFLLVRSISGAAKTLGTNSSFPVLTLVPLIGNISKYRATVEGSRYNDQIERGIRAVINTILRLTMLVAPVLVLFGWIFSQPLVLKFDEFETTTLLLSIVVMTYLIADGRSNYFEGLMLIGTYLIMSFSFYVRPETSSKVDWVGP